MSMDWPLWHYLYAYNHCDHGCSSQSVRSRSLGFSPFSFDPFLPSQSNNNRDRGGKGGVDDSITIELFVQ
jgi:hypothetical protein